MVPPYMGRGRPHTYPPGIVSTNPIIKLVFVARGSTLGEFDSCK